VSQPARGESLLEKAMRLEAIQAQRHLFEGQVLGHVVLPPVGREDYLTGNFEDNCISTGQYLAAESFRCAVTGEVEARRRAQDSAAALTKLRIITGTQGFFGRGFKTAAGPTWDEECYFFPREWHQAGEYRWLGDPSADSFNGWTFGWSCYFDLAADEEGKRQAADEVNRVVSQWIENDFRLLDVDGRMTLWGNFNPHILEEDLNALQALNHLKCAHHITGEERFEREYWRLIRDFGYADRAMLAKVLPHGSTPPWDDNLGMTALFHLAQYEQERALTALYRESLARYWSALKDDPNPFFQFVHKVLESHSELHPRTLDWFRSYEPATRRRTIKPRYPEDAPGVEADTENSPHGFLRSYWMGRYYGFISEHD
jgi:hypothetical protein